MKETEITSEWIDRYNDDELDEVEKAMFQNRMQSNPMLRSEVYIDACLNQFLGDYGLLDLMNKVGSASQRKTSSCSLINSILIIASVLLLSMIAGIFYLILTNTGTNTMRTLKHINHVNNRTGDTPDTMNNTTKFLNFGALDSLPVIPLKSEHGLSENFESLAEFELLISSVTRSGQFRLISPEMTASVSAGAEVQFACNDGSGGSGIFCKEGIGLSSSRMTGCQGIVSSEGALFLAGGKRIILRQWSQFRP